MEKCLEDVLNIAGIAINGNSPWDIAVHNHLFYDKILHNTELALGESYMDGWWDCVSLDQFFYRIISLDLENVIMHHSKFWKYALRKKFFTKISKIFNPQTMKRSLRVARKHYDIGNDLYSAMLDKRMIYTCGYWDNVDNLEDAQEKKLALTCEKLDLKPGMKVLDIGCGWGGTAQYMAERHGVSVVGISISQEQIELGQKRCFGLPVTLKLKDYRELLQYPEQFDRIVSLGMFEHVGYKNYQRYFDIISRCLKDNGLFLLHTIGSNVSKINTDDWINRYIFPNGQLPSIVQIGKAIEGKFIMEDWHNFGVFYDQTLMAWYHNFNQHWDTLRSHYDEKFRRMWNYYLLSCAGGFRARTNQLWQILLSKKGLEKGYRRPS